MLRNTLFHQLAKNSYGFALGSDHPHVLGPRLNGPAQHPHIVPVSTSDDHNVGGLVRTEPGHGTVVVLGNHLFSFGKPLPIGIALAVVNHGDFKPSITGDLVEVESYVPGAKNVERCWREDRLDENVEGTPAY